MPVNGSQQQKLVKMSSISVQYEGKKTLNFKDFVAVPVMCRSGLSYDRVRYLMAGNQL